MIRLTRSAPPLVSSTITVSTGDNPLNSPTRPQEHAWTEPVLATPAQNSLSDLWTERRSIHHLITAPLSQKTKASQDRRGPLPLPHPPRRGAGAGGWPSPFANLPFEDLLHKPPRPLPPPPPQTRHHPRRPSVHKAPRQPHQSFAF